MNPGIGGIAATDHVVRGTPSGPPCVTLHSMISV